MHFGTPDHGPPPFATSGVPYLATRPYTLSGFEGAEDTLRAMVEAAQSERGEKSMVVRSLVDEIVAELHPKDYLGEIVVIRNWVIEHIRYLNDPLHVELLKDPQTLVEEYLERGIAVGDCDDMACTISTMHLLLGRDCQLVAVGFAAPGEFSHVFERAREPRSGAWIICDPVAGTREREMAGRATTWQIWSLDELPSHGPIESV